jgi:hypothetical protein
MQTTKNAKSMSCINHFSPMQQYSVFAPFAFIESSSPFFEPAAFLKLSCCFVNNNNKKQQQHYFSSKT